MKHVLISCLLWAGTATPNFAQTVPGPPKQFCRVAVYLRSSNGYATSIDMIYGQESKKAPTVAARLAEEATQVHALDSTRRVPYYKL